MLNTLSFRARRTLRAIVVGVMLPLALSFGAAAAAPPDAQLAITLTNGVETVADGDAVMYTAEIRNSGSTVNARVVLAPPAYVTLGAAEGATVEENEATWSLPLDSGSTTTLEIPARFAEIPEGEVRATALVSVYIGDSAAPLIRTAVANNIEGVDDEQVVAPAAGTLLLWVGIGAVLVLAAAAVILLVLRSRRKAAEPSAADAREDQPVD
ncbi:hypothetical protein [Microbacterium sp.]|uniref:hypothetical protein n=1 Tax=Microbacterium sp. TaxID=51671 RepID=UPI00273440B2|nr:hypothetical protein [Microbacterium sp.]MDP3951828.1 hypothetical protein [Microbacterium sp.]